MNYGNSIKYKTNIWCFSKFSQNQIFNFILFYIYKLHNSCFDLFVNFANLVTFVILYILYTLLIYISLNVYGVTARHRPVIYAASAPACMTAPLMLQRHATVFKVFVKMSS